MLLHNLSEVVAVSILHSLWQCLLIYFVLRILLAGLFGFNANTKYHITNAGLLLSAVCFLYTLFNQASNYSWQLTSQAANFNHLPLWLTIKHTVASSNNRYELTIARYLPYITTTYAIGLLFNSLRLLTGWLQIQQLKQQSQTDYALQQTVNRLCAVLKLNKTVTLLCSDKISVPCITGYLKPLILMPLSLVNYLSVQEVESILLHELAHAKRNDYLINLLQQVISVVLFFNPFVYLMSRIANRERENSCDDMVVHFTGKPLIYAQALLKIEQNSVQQWQLALAATGKNKFHLLNRIERIMKTKKPTANIKQVLLAFTILAFSLSCIAWLNPSIAEGRLSVKKVKLDLAAVIADTILTKKTTKAESKTAHNGKRKRTIHVNNEFITEGLNDPKLEQLSADVQKHGDAISKYFESEDFKKMQADMEKAGADMEAYYNRDEIKNLQRNQEKLSKEIEASWGDSGEIHDISKKMEVLGKRIETYFNSSAFKKQDAQLRRKYNIPQDYNYKNGNNENYRKYQQELNKYIPAEITAQTNELKDLGNKISSHYESAEFKAKINQAKLMGDSIRKVFNSDMVKMQKEKLQKLSEQMRNYQNSPAYKREQEQLKIATDKLRQYTNSDEFKKKVKEWKQNEKAMNLDHEGDNPSIILSAPPEVTAPVVPDVPPLTEKTAPAPEPAKP